MAYGSSQAVGQIGAAMEAYTTIIAMPDSSCILPQQLAAMSDPQPTERGQRLNPHPHGHFIKFLTHWSTTGTPLRCIAFNFNFLSDYLVSDHLRCPMQCFIVCSQTLASTTTINFRTISSLWREKNDLISLCIDLPILCISLTRII